MGYIISTWHGEKGIKCNTCYRVSYNRNDIERLFCGYCMKFHKKK